MAWLMRNRDASSTNGYAEKSTRQLSRTKTATASACRPPKRLKLKSSQLFNPIILANDLLESAYTARNGPDGDKNLAEGTKLLQSQRMKDAKSYEEWKQAADKLDILEGNHYYKFDEESDECDMGLLRKRLERLKQANHDDDIEEMVQQIRNSLQRDLGGMCNPRLYQHAWLGTKHLIEEYTEVVKYTIERIVKYCQQSEDHDLVLRYKETMKAAKASFGNTALMLSGGGTLGMCHVGVVKALCRAGLLPKVVCGASAGSIVASVLCTHKPSEIVSKLEELCSGDLSVFQSVDEWQGIPGMVLNVLKGDPCFNVSNLCRVMKGLLGNITFREANNVTGLTLNIHVSCRDKHNLPRLLNYQTAPNVVIWTAVASSCALPWVFEPPGLQAKNPKTGKLEHWGHLDHKWIDGSIEGDLPARTLERLFNVNNFLASQVNPHVGPFLPKEGEDPSMARRGLRAGAATAIWTLDAFMDRGYDYFFVKMVHSILSQKYDGDITVLPDISWVPTTKILANPTHEFMMKATREGEKATWPKLDRIHNSVAIELALHNACMEIQARSIGGSDSRRAPSTTRSEHGLSSTGLHKRRSGLPGGLGPLPGFNRGRQAAHRPVRSMFKPALLPPAAQANGTDHLLSSSDEARSGQSSPLTSYDDEDFDDIHDPDDQDSQQAEMEQRLRAFLSQPTSPSISMKSYWGSDSISPRSQVPPQTPPSPPSLEMKRAFSGLFMSSIEKQPPSSSSSTGRNLSERKE
ncbi:Lipase 4 [Lecanosticta acicola]|uniref:Patatin-like phospholipase domain-containing protein n=1 Tax=Lecanosticta acicola TaxID=111012 RepID=A0AAI9EA79_9PEZI|nr:Lipase 4 [Lecanosticta acicola]